MFHFFKTNIEEINLYRIDYLKSLPVFQDIFLEFLIRDSISFKILNCNATIGYMIISPDKILLELYVQDQFIHLFREHFGEAIEKLEIRRIYCKSFDHFLLDLCISKHYQYQLIGCLYRDYFDNEINISNDLSIRYANESDLPFLLQQDDEVFEPKELLVFFVKNNQVLVFEKKQATVGCGFITQVHQMWNCYDLGVWVHPDFRRKGYATQIISYLKKTCLNIHGIPVCGCDIKNIASQKTLLKAGFISKHKLIEFTI